MGQAFVVADTHGDLGRETARPVRGSRARIRGEPLPSRTNCMFALSISSSAPSWMSTPFCSASREMVPNSGTSGVDGQAQFLLQLEFVRASFRASRAAE